MNAKDYLGQAYRLDQRINSKLQQISSLRSLTQRVTASFDGEVVSHTRNVTSLEDAIIRLMEAEEELNRQIDRLVDMKIDIAKLKSPRRIKDIATSSLGMEVPENVYFTHNAKAQQKP